MPGTGTTSEEQIAFVRRLLQFGVVAESLPVAIEATLGLDRDAAQDLVDKALTEDGVSVIFPESHSGSY